MVKNLHFKLNGKEVRLSTSPDRMLLWVLRSELGQTGTKHSCGEGFCGACTVLVNNEAVLSCQYPVKNVAGKNVLTIEGLAKNGNLRPLQRTFMEHNALQCGFCTPGMIMASYGLLVRNPRPSKKEIAAAMERNLCRCGSYNRIIAAIQSAARMMRGQGS